MPDTMITTRAGVAAAFARPMRHGGVVERTFRRCRTGLTDKLSKLHAGGQAEERERHRVDDGPEPMAGPVSPVSDAGCPPGEPPAERVVITSGHEQADAPDASPEESGREDLEGIDGRAAARGPAWDPWKVTVTLPFNGIPYAVPETATMDLRPIGRAESAIAMSRHGNKREKGRMVPRMGRAAG